MRINTKTTDRHHNGKPKLSFSKSYSSFQRIYNIIQHNLENEQLSVEFLAIKVHLSVSQLNRKVNEISNQPASKLIRDLKMQYASSLLKEKRHTVSEIAYRIGYANAAHFCRSFKRHFGCTPSDYHAQKW